MGRRHLVGKTTRDVTLADVVAVKSTHAYLYVA